MAGGGGGAQPVGAGAGLDDVGVGGEPVDDRGAQPGIGEGGGPLAERGVGRDRDGGFLFPFGEDLEQQLGAAAVQPDVAELVQAQKVDPAVTADHPGQRLLVGGPDQLVDQGGGGDVPDPAGVLGGRGAPPSPTASSPRAPVRDRRLPPP